VSCETCGDTGWKDVVVNGIHYAQQCDHGASQRHDLQPLGEIAATSQAVQELVLTPLDRAVRDIITQRVGLARAVTIREIVASLPPQIMVGKDAPRDIKDSVRRLREFMNLRVAASKRPPYGYFIVQTADEADEFAQRIFSEGVKLMRLCRMFRPERDWVQELRGQLQLTVTSDK
jgi:hypothetical protein